MEKELLIVTDENGNEIECEIVLTFESEETKKAYVVYQVKGEEDGEYFAASFDPNDDGEGKLYAIETDEEWALVEEVLESFFDDEEETEEDDHCGCGCHHHEEE